MIFQEPMTSLTPAYTVGDHITEAITLHQGVDKREAKKRALDILNRVGMPQPARTIESYPHQLSGGMLQRAMIAIALSCRPILLIADEPTTALDVTTGAQILDLMESLQQELGMSIIHISHNLGVIAEVADEVAVMYLGRIVEQAPVDELFNAPKHPYTQGLLRSLPQVGEQAAPGADSRCGARAKRHPARLRIRPALPQVHARQMRCRDTAVDPGGAAALHPLLFV